MRYLIFLFIPICVYLVVIPLRKAWGHYYYAINSDPSYLYLFNGLNIAQGEPSAHVDNPGTTTQLFSALVIRATAIGKGVDDIQKDIILHPEEWIIIINRVLFVTCMAVLFLFGVFAFKFTGRLWFSLFLQTVPFYSWQLMRIFLKVSPEMMIFIACLLWVLTLLRLSAKDDFKEHHLKYTIWFAFLTAFSLATKLTMIPFILIPLILMPLRPSINYLLLSFILFHMFIFPAWEHYDYMVDWIGKLFQHSSLYGRGEPNIINFSDAIFGFGKLVSLEHPLYLTVFAAVLILTIVYLNNFLRDALRHSIDTKILLSLVAVIIVQLLMVAKHFNPHYLIPSLMLFTGIIYFTIRLYLHIVSLKPDSIKRAKSIGAKSSLFILLIVGFLIRHTVKNLPGKSFGEWISETMLSNMTWLVGVLILFFTISILLKRHPKARRGFLNISIYFAVIAYSLRHADIRGFMSRLATEARSSQLVMDTINERYNDYTVIYGERSSSIYYALKYGANENFSQPNHFERMKELYQNEPYFWDHSDKFKTWTEETTLSAIVRRHEKVLLECDLRYTPIEYLKELQAHYDLALGEVPPDIPGHLYIVTLREY